MPTILRTAMTANVEVEGKSQLLLVRDYLEKAGLVETVRALEAEADIQSTRPGLATVRSLALDGKWRELEKSLLLQPKKEDEECELLQKAKFSLAKQQYLEAVAGLDAISSYRQPSADELGQAHRFLERLDQLAPSKEEYDNLETLLHSQTDFFDKWNLQRARNETCNVLLEWSKMACFGGRGSVKKTGNSEKETHLLTLLLAKGKIYEECEQVCREKCTGLGTPTAGALLDISSWLQNKPSEFFQEVPPLLKVVSTTLPSEPQLSTAVSGRGTASAVGTEPAEVKATPALAKSSQKPLHSVSQWKSPPKHVEEAETDPVKIESGRNFSKDPAEEGVESKLGCSPGAPPHTALSSPAERGTSERITAHKELVEKATDRARESLRETTSGEQVTKELHTSREMQEPLHLQKECAVTTQPSPQHSNQATSNSIVTQPSTQHPVTTTQPSPQHPVTTTQPPPQHPTQPSPQQPTQPSTQYPTQPSPQNTITTIQPSPQHPTQHPVTTSPPSQHPISHILPLPHPTPHHTQPHGFQDDFSTQPLSWLLQTTPLVHSLQKEGRNSSTPKPSAHQILSSPPTSPVPHIPVARYSQATPKGQGPPTLSERKQIDFDKETMDSQRTTERPSPLSVSWPTATLSGKVTDTQAIRSVGFSQSGELVAVGANSKYLRLYSTTSILDDDRGEEVVPVQEYPRYHRGSIYCLAWLGDNLLVSGSNDKTIKLLSCHSNSDTVTCDSNGRMTFHEGTVRDLTFLFNGQLVSGGSGNPSLVISDPHTLKMVCILSCHTKQVLAVSCGSGGSVCVSGGEDKTVRLWDWAARQCVHTLELSEVVTSLSCHGHHLGVALLDGSCATYDVRNWSQVTAFQPHSNECRSIRHSPCGKWLLTGSYDGSVCLSEAAATEWVEIAQHGDKVIQARWHPQGQLFASTSTDKTVCFWTLQ